MGIPVKDWLYFITDGGSKTARMVGDTPQMLGGNPVPLPENPEGWRDFETGWATDTKYNSLNRSATIPTTFTGDGEKIIRYAMLKQKGFNQTLYLVVLHKNPTTGVFQLEYTGRLDMTKPKDSILKGITVNAIQGGPMFYIAANESVEYTFDQTATNLNTKKVLFDGMSFKEKVSFKGENVQFQYLNTPVPIVQTYNDGFSFNLVYGTQTPEPFTNAVDYSTTSANYFLKTYQNLNSANLSGDIRIANYGIANFVAIALFKSDGSYVNLYTGTLPAEFSPGVPSTTVIPINHDFTLLKDQAAFLLYLATGNNVVAFDETNLELTLQTKNQPSVHRGFDPLYLWQQLISKISNGECVGASNYFSTHTNIKIFSGQSLRNLTKAVLKASVSGFFDFYDSIKPMGLKLDGNTVYIEPLSDLYGEGADLLDLGEIANPSLSFAFDALTNTGKFGYPHPGSSATGVNATTGLAYNTNGVPEFNGTNSFSFPVTVVKKEYNKVGQWIAAASEIEKLRTSVTPINSNASNNTDNEVYVANVSEVQDVDGNYLLTRIAYASISGVVDGADVYNIEELTPARMVRAHGPILSAIVEQQGNAPIVFQSADLSADLITQQGSVTISEKGNIYPGDLAPAIMRMLDLEGSVAIRDSLTFNDVLTAVNKGLIQVQFLGAPIYGLPIGSFKCKPASNEPQDIKFRISTRTSLNTLYSLSLPGTFSIDELNNTIFISDLNPLHFSKYGFSPSAGFHHLELYDAQFQLRNDRYNVKPQYLQPFQQNDPLPLNFVTTGYGVLTVKTYSFEQLAPGVDIILKTVAEAGQQAAFTALLAATAPMQTNNAALVAETAVQLPYVLQKASIDLSALPEGRYVNVLYDGTTPLFMSEWIDLREDWPETFAFDYYDTQNKRNTYWGNGFRPRIRVEANFMPLEPQSDFSSFVDEIKDNEPLDGRPWDKRILILGSGSGIPDWMARKLNSALLLNRCAIEGDYWSRNGDAKLEPVKREGYPMNYYTVEVAPQKASYGLVYTGTPAASQDVIAYTLDAMAFGMGSGVIDIEVIDD